MHAIEKGNIKIVKELIRGGADVNRESSDEYHTPLTMAIELDNIAIVEELIRGGANVNDEGGYGYETPLITAISNIEILKVLISAGADVNYVKEEDDDIDDDIDEDEDIEDIEDEDIDDEDIEDRRGDSPLIIASRLGNIEIVKELLHSGANIYHVNKHGDCAISIAHNNKVRAEILK